MLPDLPFRLRHNKRDERGYIVPWVNFVDDNGKPNFTTIDEYRMIKAIRQKLCGMCGQHMKRGYFFIGGPLCVANGFFYDPPMHKECAEYAMQACPHLARSKGKYIPTEVAKNMSSTKQQFVVGAMSEKKAEWFAIMQADEFTWGRSAEKMIMVKATLPWISVERWRDGNVMEDILQEEPSWAR